MSASQVKTIITNLTVALTSLAEFNGGKIFSVISEDDLFSDAQRIPYPAVGVVYEGMRPATAHESGLAARANFALIILTQDKFPAGLDTKFDAIDIMDRIRAKLRVTSADPALPGHKWKFEFEAPATSKANKVLVWVQRWSIPLQLTQSPAGP